MGADEAEGASERVLQTMRWGLVPSWHKGEPESFSMMLNNCRSESMTEKASFRNPLNKGQRCVVVVEGSVLLGCAREVCACAFVSVCVRACVLQ